MVPLPEEPPPRSLHVGRFWVLAPVLLCAKGLSALQAAITSTQEEPAQPPTSTSALPGATMRWQESPRGAAHTGRCPRGGDGEQDIAVGAAAQRSSRWVGKPHAMKYGNDRPGAGHANRNPRVMAKSCPSTCQPAPQSHNWEKVQACTSQVSQEVRAAAKVKTRIKSISS